jgi:hypothetical protein
MKKAYLLCSLLLALAASVASAAAGVNLRWNGCIADGGVINKNFACNANTGTNTLAGSFELGADQHAVKEADIVVDLASASPSLPDWWQYFNVGACRRFALSIAADGCVAGGGDWAVGKASMNIAAYQLGNYGPNTARILCANAIQPTAVLDLFAATEYGVFRLSISNLKTVGSPSCAGCQTPVCIVFNSLKTITTTNVDNRLLTGPTNGTDSDYVTWQGSIGVVTPLGQGCPQATPTRNATWGSVKAHYR